MGSERGSRGLHAPALFLICMALIALWGGPIASVQALEGPIWAIPSPATHPIGSGLPASHRIDFGPIVWQRRNWCGPASLTMVLNYWGDRVDQETVGRTIDP
ncbi:MAG: C39 family peptidase, partial [Candidatus Bathyarchaeia archaeon]